VVLHPDIWIFSVEEFKMIFESLQIMVLALEQPIGQIFIKIS